MIKSKKILTLILMFAIICTLSIGATFTANAEDSQVTTTSPNLVSNQIMWTSPSEITFATPYKNVTSASFAAQAATTAISAAFYYLYDSQDNLVATLDTYPENYGTTSGTQNFDQPIEVAKVIMYSWWNPAYATSLVLTSTETVSAPTTPNLVSNQFMWTSPNEITFATPYKNVTSASFAAQAASTAISAAFYYLYDSQNNLVATLDTYPENYGTTSGTQNFDQPIEVAKVIMYSWWNPALAKDLKLTQTIDD